ncbi:MAG: SGNH/GDSL hydrolase family protein [Euzebya sp.]
MTDLGTFHRATMPAGKALLIVLIALLLGGLLNVRSLTEAAERQPNGLSRDIALVMVWPFQRISSVFGLDQPRALLTQRLGRDVDAGTAAEPTATVATTGGDVELDAQGNPVDPLSGDALAAAAAVAGREAEDPALADATAIPAGLDPDAPALLTAAELPERLQVQFTATNPLRIAVIGDSLTEQLGPAIIDRVDQPGVPATATHDFTYSSGLTRPDFYDWPAKAADLATTLDPDVWVVMMGANDAQDVRDAQNRFRHIGSDEWEQIYTARVGALMDELLQDGRAVIWVGQPLMRSTSFDESMDYISSLYRREASSRSLVSYVDARRVFEDPAGRYADYLADPSGQLVQMRLPDGVHLTRAGADRLAEQVFPLLPVLTDPDAAAVPVSQK